MAIPQLFRAVLSRSIFALTITLLLSACGTDENNAGATLDAGAEVAQGAIPDPVPDRLPTPDPVPEPRPLPTPVPPAPVPPAPPHHQHRHQS